MGDNIRSFPDAKSKSTINEKLMVRVIDVTSPFFSWEGWIINTFEALEDERQFIQIFCAHNGFQFPALTFSVNQVTKVR